MTAPRQWVPLGCALLVACGTDSAGEPAPNNGTDASGAGGTEAMAADSGEHGQGMPIDAPAEQWTWVEFSGARCRDGSPTGIFVNPTLSMDRVLVYLQGGGACFNEATCANNAENVEEALRTAGGDGTVPGSGGMFDRADPANPLRDWSLVYVPYCTGDNHFGNAPDQPVDGLSAPQQFVGYANMRLFLTRIAPTFPGASQVLLAGTSAGGLGAHVNFVQTQRAFGETPVTMLSDALPLFSSTHLSTCGQQMVRVLWNTDAGLLVDCNGCFDPNDPNEALLRWLSDQYPDRTFGLASHLEDAIIRSWMGWNNAGCPVDQAPTLAPGDPLAATGAEYTAALEDLRDRVLAGRLNWATYYAPGERHSLLVFYQTLEVTGTKLTVWIEELLAGSPRHVAP